MSETEAVEEKSVDLSEMFPAEEGKEQPKQEKAVAEEGVKEKATSSPEDASEETDEEDLKGKIEGLTKELGRVRKDRNASADAVGELREQLAHLRGQLETLGKRADQDSPTAAMSKYSDEQLVQGQSEWEEELLDARVKLQKARDENNEASVEKAQRAANVAKNTLSAIRKELLDRTKRVGSDTAKAQGEAQRVVQEVVQIYDRAYESFPDLKDKDSAIWAAGNEEYNAHPTLMKQLGPLGELVAVALAVAGNPELVGGTKKAVAARKELLSEINDLSEKSLIKGGSKAKTKGTPQFDSMNNQDFDKIIQQIKMGG